jgi:hypothetical protein
VFAFEDDYSFGILQSKYHRRWFEERCSSLGDTEALRYTSRTIWSSFPWPQAPSDDDAVAVASAAEDVLMTRERYLATGLTLGEQYNTLREPGNNSLRDAHERLDNAVTHAYGFSEDDDPIAQLLALNESIVEEEDRAQSLPRPPGNWGLGGTEKTDVRIRAFGH